MAVLAAALVHAPGAAGRQAEWRAEFAAGDAARAEGNAAAYARHMAAAVAAMPPGLLNRPFAQYHAARAYALTGDGAEAVRWLRVAWDEDLEPLMTSFAAFDPAFDALRDDPGLAEVLGRAASLSLEVTPLRGSAYLLHGAGARLVASVGSDGVLLVDTGYRPALPALRRALANLGRARVDVLVLTHPHEDHWGSVAELAGEATVLAHPRTAAALAEPYTFIEGVVVPPRPAEAARGVAAALDTTLVFNGEAVRIVPMEAHTEGDVLVWLTGSGVVHLGDAWLGGNPMMYPGTRDPDGFLERMDAFLDELPAGTVVVGGHDPPAGPAVVRAQVAETRACMAMVRRALSEGLSRDETVTRAEGRFAAPWVRFFYNLLSDGA